MMKNEILDYDKDYRLRLATNKELTRIKGYDFLNYLTDLMVKYSDSIGEAFSIEMEREIWQQRLKCQGCKLICQ